MSNARKLQTEIDRVMKKVDEGVLLFDDIWEKVYSAEQQNQKEKYEMDLKKEIKKLQRLRDQIKTWIGSSDVKDKDALIEARKLIETKMEQFKICEKETKTKTYSKEGLARAEKMDPEEEAKLDCTNWIREYIDKLSSEIEDKEVEIERLSAGKGKKTNKHQIDQFNQYILNHKFHINKLEGIIRLVNNDRLDVDTVNPIKEDLDYYLDSYGEEDYQQAYDEDFFYEALGLEDLDVVNVDRVTINEPLKKKNSMSSNATNDDTTSQSSKGSKDKKSTKKSALASVIPITIGRARTSTSKDINKKDEKEEVTPSKLGRVSSTASASSSTAAATPAPPPTRASAPAPAPGAPGTSMAAILKRETEQQEKERQKLLREQQARAQQEQLQKQQQLQRQQQEAQIRQQEQLLQQQAQQAQQEQQLKLQQQEQLRQQQEAAAKKQQAAQLQAQQQAEQNNAQKLQGQQLQSQGGQPGGIDILTSGLGGLALGGGSGAAGAALTTNNANAASSNNFEGSNYLSALNDSFANMPNTVDNERSRQYTPQNPYPTPSSYPSTPSPIFENPVVFEKLGTDCLFFIFYYSQGTYQQYLAARELKKQSWRFHKKYMTWFQRHEEPKVTTDEYEQGTYVYFDYETGWCTRIKTDFRFEYSYLEDSLQ